MITESIQKVIVEYDVEQGRRPGKIYLGYTQWREMKDWAEQICYVTIPASFSRPQFCGIDLIQVNENDYIACGP